MRYIVATIIAVATILGLPTISSAATCATNSTGSTWSTNNSGGTSLRSDVDDGTGTGACSGTVNIGLIGGKAVTQDACQANARTPIRINITGAGTAQIITGSLSKLTYFCSISFPNQTVATTFALIEGSGNNCSSITGSAGILGGGITAATGFSIPINGGFNFGDGTTAIAVANGASADNICIVSSAAIAGNMMIVQQ